jgi:hypothetical protein
MLYSFFAQAAAAMDAHCMSITSTAIMGTMSLKILFRHTAVVINVGICRSREPSCHQFVREGKSSGRIHQSIAQKSPRHFADEPSQRCNVKL